MQTQTDQITPEELKAELSRPEKERPVLLDVRETEEWLESKIDGCKLIPLGEVIERGPKELDKNANIVIYCAAGVRSMRALRALQTVGFTHLRSLVGGIHGWHDLIDRSRT